MAKQDKVVLIAVGDTHAGGETAEKKFALTAPMLREADIAFCQLEEILSGRVNPAWNWAVAVNGAGAAKTLANAGFDVISVAGNHHMIGGLEAFVDTLDALKQNNIVPVGVGMNLAEARAPTIVERKGTKV